MYSKQSFCLNERIAISIVIYLLFLTLTSFFQLENLRERIEEESEKKSDALKALSKAQAEIQLWRSKFETEGLGRIDELDSSKQKLSVRLSEAEETIENLNQKIASTEKTKHRLETELEDLQLEYERVHAAAIITEKRGKNFDKVSRRRMNIFYNVLMWL
jgi:myosin heavy chain 6/7